MTFLPPNYEVPTSGNYTKLQDGQNKLMILGSAVLGYEYWTLDNKPVRLNEMPMVMPSDIRVEEDGKKSAVKHFWAFPVFNYKTKKVEILEITQKGIMGALQNLARSEEWGDPVLSYSLTITRSGSGFDTEYNVVPNPKTELPADIGDAWEKVKAAGFSLQNLFTGADPFTAGAEQVVVDADAQVDPTEAQVPAN